MKVECEARTIWEIDEERFFAEYYREWEEFMGEDIPTDEDKLEFIKEVLWEVVPHFQDIGGVELYDDYEIDVEI